MSPEAKRQKDEISSSEDIIEKLQSILRELLSEGFPPKTFVGLIVHYPITGMIKTRAVGAVPNRDALVQLYTIAAEAIAKTHSELEVGEKPPDNDEPPVLN